MQNRDAINAVDFDDAFNQILWRLRTAPHYVCKPRGSLIQENLVQTITLLNPRARLLSVPARETNYGFAVGEFLWYWSGRQDLETMLYYNKRMKDFSDDGKTLNSAYGFRMHCDDPGLSPHGVDMSQWEICIETLSQDPDSRRAIILINSPRDQAVAAVKGSKDVPCTLSLQFFIRDNRLHLHAHMRSNDVMWGLTYDLFSFTLFQECMLLELQKSGKFKDLRLGKYIHTAGSMHLYEKHFELADKICSEYSRGVEISKPMEPITSIEDLYTLIDDEEFLRTKKIDLIDTRRYSGTLKWMAERLNDHRFKRDNE